MGEEKVDTYLHHFVSVGKKKITSWFPDPSLEYGVLGGVSRSACLYIFHLINVSLSFWTVSEI